MESSITIRIGDGGVVLPRAKFNTLFPSYPLSSNIVDLTPVTKNVDVFPLVMNCAELHADKVKLDPSLIEAKLLVPMAEVASALQHERLFCVLACDFDRRPDVFALVLASPSRETIWGVNDAELVDIVSLFKDQQLLQLGRHLSEQQLLALQEKLPPLDWVMMVIGSRLSSKKKRPLLSSIPAPFWSDLARSPDANNVATYIHLRGYADLLPR